MLHLIKNNDDLKKYSAFNRDFIKVFRDDILAQQVINWNREDLYGIAGNHYSWNIYFMLFKYFELYHKEFKLGFKTIDELNIEYNIKDIRKSAACFNINIGEYYDIFNLIDSVDTDWMISEGSIEENFEVEGYIIPVASKSNVDLSNYLDSPTTCINVLTGCGNNCKSTLNIVVTTGVLGADNNDIILTQNEVAILVGSRTITYTYNG